MSKKVFKAVTKPIAKIIAPKPPTPAPAAAPEPAAAASPTTTAAEDKKAIYDSAARRVRRGRAAGYRALMTDRNTLGGGGSTLG